MEPSRDDQLIADLQALRPTPRPQFAAELDERAAAGFPRRSRLPRLSLDRLRAVQPRRLLLPAGTAAVAAIAIAAVLVIGSLGGSSSSSTSQQHGSTLGDLQYFDGSGHYAKPAPEARSLTSGASAAKGATNGKAEIEPFSQNLMFSRNLNSSFTPRHRDVERSAEVVLAAQPEDVAGDATRVFEAVHANNGIVMRSSTQEGAAGEAGASFELLIPSHKLGDAMAAFSEIDAVRSRREATADITAPTVSAAVLLKESRARIDSLLAQLEGAETEEEREAIEAELRHERRHASRLAAQLTHLHRRADFSRVALRIETGSSESSGGGAWGIDDALHDAGHVLTVAAAVMLVALAALGPIALIALIAWLTHRAWVRRERRRVVG
ncbi:MAG TPA: DUF4349 domain-containing protein [Solirubrobacterales bacterium]|nr:DUF4349 domain-containing protein [Solirubrobacterales bacterium]